MHSVAQATPASSPSSPNWPFLLVAGLGIGLFLGLAYALGRQFLDTRIASDDQLRTVPGLEAVPFLGSLSHRRRRNRPANVLTSEPHSVPAEEYRRVATNLEFAGIDERIGSITVTSALPGDGKSTTALNLAAAAAERGQSVLLVDGDLRRPSVAEYLGIDGGVGLTNVLLGTASVAQAVQRIGDVDVLPSGALPPNVTQLVTSHAMERVIGELLARYDFVVVDAPPVLPVVDALTFARLTAGALVVARQRVTRRKQFAQAVQSLLQVDAKIVGIVLNDVPRADNGYGYGYGYAPATAERRGLSRGSRRPAEEAKVERAPQPALTDR
jgi:capsular exopolysaccharide synthesis family protein